jgi:hypothetical protein
MVDYKLSHATLWMQRRDYIPKRERKSIRYHEIGDRAVKNHGEENEK